MHPTVRVVLNVELDHVDFFENLENVIDSFSNINTNLDNTITLLQTIKKQVNNGEKPSLTNLNALSTIFGTITS